MRDSFLLRTVHPPLPLTRRPRRAYADGVATGDVVLFWRAWRHIDRAILGLIILLAVPSTASTDEGWYLLLPPERAEWRVGDRVVDPMQNPMAELRRVWTDDKAPLIQWVHYRSFDRAVECEGARAEEKVAGDRLIERLESERRPELQQATKMRRDQVLRFLDRLATSRCVIATDPRLVPKPLSVR
jgi:hypothetical protein